MLTRLQKVMKVLDNLESGKELKIKVKSILSMEITVMKISEYVFSAHVGSHEIIKDKPLSHVESYLKPILENKHSNIFLTGIVT